MKKGVSALGFLALASPVTLIIIGVALFIAVFGGLGLLNGITSLFGIDIISGTLAAITRPVAMILALFLVYTLLTRMVLPKSKPVAPAVLALFLASIVFLLNYGVTGNLFSTVAGSTAPVVTTQDFATAVLGSAVGGILVFFLTRAR
ncbi:MAG: hypothetical protein ACE5DI_01295 [Candidatus Micrarchaeia archaeon]